MRAIKSSFQTNARLQAQASYQAPHVAIMRTMEFEKINRQRLNDHVVYQAK